VTVNIAFRPRSGDLILMNARLAKPILGNLVYSKPRERAQAPFATHNEKLTARRGRKTRDRSHLGSGVLAAETPAEDVQAIVAEKHLVAVKEGRDAEDATGIGALGAVRQRFPRL
jgi:hypothetical protein